MLVAVAVPSASPTAPRGGAPGSVPQALAEGARLQQSGDAAGALESYRLALRSAAPRSSDRGRSLLALAGVEAGLGQYTESLRHAAEAAALFDELGDEGRVGLSLNSGGVTALNAGDYAEAERLLGLALARSIRIGSNGMRAEQLANLGNVNFFIGRYADSARLYDEALAVTSASSGEAWADRKSVV